MYNPLTLSVCPRELYPCMSVSKMDRFTASPGKPLFFAFLAILSAGCNRTVIGKADKTYDKLSQIGEAYMRDTVKLDRGPANLSEITPFLEVFGDVSEIIQSDHDQETFVILWNVDYRAYERSRKIYPVIAFEKSGKNG